MKTRASLKKFILQPPSRHVEDAKPSIEEDEDLEGSHTPIEKIEYTDLDLIKTNGGSESFREVVFATNAYLCKNVGTSADFQFFKISVKRKLKL